MDFGDVTVYKSPMIRIGRLLLIFLSPVGNLCLLLDMKSTSLGGIRRKRMTKGKLKRDLTCMCMRIYIIKALSQHPTKAQ